MRAREAGFTLIELMLVVAIMGALSTVAIPEFEKMQLRARSAERSLVMKEIHTAVEEYWARGDPTTQTNHFPTVAADGTSSIFCPQNPPGAPGAQKRPVVPLLGDWKFLSLEIPPHVYYSYEVAGAFNGLTRWYAITSVGDLDGDTRQNTFIRQFTYESDAAKPTVDWDSATLDGAL